jgi:putative DNA primase/helicase
MNEQFGSTASTQILHAYHHEGFKQVKLRPDTKRPFEDEWQLKDAPFEEIERHVSAGGAVGLQVGDRSGWLCAVDLDHHIARRLAPEFLPDTLTSGKEYESLPSHYVYISEGAGFRKITDTNLKELVCLKASNDGAGHQFVVEPSVHETKGRYQWTGGFNPNRIRRISCEELDRRIGRLGAVTLIAKHLPERGRQDYALQLAGFLLRNGEDEEGAYELMAPAWTLDLGPQEFKGLRRIIRDTAKKLERDDPVQGGGKLHEAIPHLPARIGKALGWEQANMSEGRKFYYRTDYGNGQRFVDQHGELVRYVGKWRKWLVWDGARWKVDDGGLVTRLAHQTALKIFDEVKHAADTEEQKEIVQWAFKSQSKDRINAMIASAAPYMVVDHTELDKDPWLLNCENGTLDLRTGELRDPRPEDLITKLAPVSFDPYAPARTFEAFLERVLPNGALRKFVQRVLGYAITGDTSEHILPFLYGTGANGKTTLVNAVLNVLGDYGQQAAPDLLLSKRGSHPTELADLFKARFVPSVEVEDGRRFAESLLKQLTGGDRIKARRMHEDFWEFEPTHKVFLAANHKPVVRGSDHGIWRRIKLIPFEVRVPESEQDKKLPEKLSAEASGILAWLVRGCLDWQENGLGEPDEVIAATDAYRSEMDVLAAFIDDRCVVAPNAEATAKDLWGAWKSWADEAGEHVGTQKAFGGRLTERGFESFKFTSGPYKDRKGWRGIGLRSSAPDPDPEPDGVKKITNSEDGSSAAPAIADDSSARESGLSMRETSGGADKADDSGPKNNLFRLESPREAKKVEQRSASSASSANDSDEEETLYETEGNDAVF